MFEKDEDYRKAKSECKAKTTKVIKVWSAREEAIHDVSFKDGAEFGYNKANEWHYPSKGEYPIDKTEMLVYFKYADYEYPCKTFGFYNGHFWDTKRGDVSNKEVIAWKEIVFPEE